MALREIFILRLHAIIIMLILSLIFLITFLYHNPQVGIMHIQLLHTSASLTINENWDPDVRDDMEMMLNR